MFLPIQFYHFEVGKRLKATSLAQRNRSISFLEQNLTSLKIIVLMLTPDSAPHLKSTARFRKLMNAVLQRKGLAAPMRSFRSDGCSNCTGTVKLVFKEMISSVLRNFWAIGLFYTIINPVKTSLQSTIISKRKGIAERIVEILHEQNNIEDGPENTFYFSISNSI